MLAGHCGHVWACPGIMATNQQATVQVFLFSVMPPKRRAASAVKAGGKKVKEEPETSKPKDDYTSAKEALLAAGPQVQSKKKVDEHCDLSTCGEVSNKH